MAKLVKDSLPPDIKVAKEVQGIVSDCCMEFITLISSESNEICTQEKKRMIVGEHVVKALQNLEFNKYAKEV